MAKVVSCRDVGLDCDFVARGETEEELLQTAAAHGKAEHGMSEIPPEVIERVRSLIRDEWVHHGYPGKSQAPDSEAYYISENETLIRVGKMGRTR